MRPLGLLRLHQSRLEEYSHYQPASIGNKGRARLRYPSLVRLADRAQFQRYPAEEVWPLQLAVFRLDDRIYQYELQKSVDYIYNTEHTTMQHFGVYDNNNGSLEQNIESY